MKRNIKKMISVILSVMVITTMVPMNLISASAAEYKAEGSGLSGTGTADDPYLIYNANDYKEFANLVNNGNTSISAALMADITFNTDVVDAEGNLNSGKFESVTPIGTSGKYYNGTFNGNGYTISGAYIASTENYTGLFGLLDSSGVIEKLNVEDSYVQGTYYVGGVCAYNLGSVLDCTFEGLVEGTSYVGGISGWNSRYGYGYALNRCANFGAVKATGSNVGGVSAYVYNTTITNCYNTGEVSGSYNVGGIVGYNDRYAQTSNSHNIGTVTGTSNYVGAVCGRDSASIKNCYYLDKNIATDGNGTVQNGIGYYLKGQAQDDIDGCTYGYWSYLYETGAVTYDLNSGVTDGTQVWYQTLGEDMYPVFSGKTVYIETSECPYRELGYTNDSTPLGHYYENGFCEYCDAYQPALDTDNDGYYEIDNGGKLYWFAEQVNAGNPELNAVLTADIYVNEDVLDDDGMNQAGTYRAWTPIGNSEVFFDGTFDGKNHTISGLYFNDNKADYVGLVGYNRGVICNVGLLDSYFYGLTYTGGIAGYNASGDVNYCYNASFIRGGSRTGGIVGDGYGYVTYCGNTGRVLSSEYAGGIAGVKKTGTLSNCYNTGYVMANSDVGSICGTIYSYPSNCYYIPGTATSGGGVNEQGVGDFADKDGATTAKTAEQFASGEVTYLLNKGVTDGTQIWYQTLGTDTVPKFEGETVYCGYVSCNANDKVYSNSKLSDTEVAHNYENGFCTVCDAYEPALDTDNDGYYEIDNGGKLYWFAQQVNEGNVALNAILTADIYVNEGLKVENGEVNYGEWREWTPIGRSYIDQAYAGTFNGNRHTISGLFLNNDEYSFEAGLFGFTNDTAIIKELGLLDSYFSSYAGVGGICGTNCGLITDCFNAATIVGQYYAIGGICGWIGSGEYAEWVDITKGRVVNCYNVGTVMGGEYRGAITGIGFSYIDEDGVEQNAIENCYYTYDENKDSFNIFEGDWYTDEEFASGEIAYLLNKGVTDGTQIWYQTIGTDAAPVFSGKTVYYGYKKCDSPIKVYSNDEISEIRPAHDYENGFCKECDAYEPALDTDNDGYYEIDNAGKLYWFAEQINGGNIELNAILTADITVNKNVLAENGEVNFGDYRKWTPIGNKTTKFEGEFDGKGHTISGIFFNDNTADFVGLFGWNAGVIRNLGLLDSYFYGNEYVGGIAGYNGTTIQNCYNASTVNATKLAGGIAGDSYGGIKNCYNVGAITSGEFAGGITGHKRTGSLGNCYNLGFVTAERYVGSICGSAYYAPGNNYYLPDTAVDTTGLKHNGVGTDSNTEAKADVDGQTTAKTAQQFASGEVAYLLNNGTTDGTQVWYQTIGTDTAPKFVGETVYGGYKDCKSTEKTYSNTKLYETIPTHNFENGSCTICGEKEPAKDITIYLKPNSNWPKDKARFAAYLWTSEEETFVDMVDTNGDGYYEITVKDSWENIIFCRIAPNTETSWKNVWNQTNDLVIPYDGRNCYTIAEGAWSKGDGTWSEYIPPEKAVSILGDINLTLVSSDENIFTGAVELDEGTYSFNVNDSGTLVGFNYTFTDTATIDYSAGYKAPTKLVVSGGRYIFTYNSTSKKLTIKYKPFAEIVELFGDINVELVRTSSTSTVFTGSARVEAGAYKFKINDQGTTMGFGFTFDDVVYGVQYRAEWSGETTFNATGGIYSVVYDTETNKLTFKHAPKGLGDVRVFGDINLPLASQGNGIYSAQTTLESGAYQFRVDSLGTTICNGSSFTDTMNGVEYKTDWKAATTFVASEKQKFTFIFDTNTNQIKVFNSPIDTTKVLVAFENSTLELASTDDVNYTATTSLEAGKYTFRMDEFGVTLGYGGAYTDEIKGIKYNASYSSATTFNATGGEYIFSYNINTDVLKVTKA